MTTSSSTSGSRSFQSSIKLFLNYTIIITTIIPTSTGCNDSPFRFKFIKNNRTITRSCKWVSNKNAAYRCSNFYGISDTCVSTCGSCTVCSDSPLQFKFEYNGKIVTRTCLWTARKNTSRRCSIDGMDATCRKTCNTCSTSMTSNPTDSPSTSSTSPSFVPSLLPTSNPTTHTSSAPSSSSTTTTTGFVCPPGTKNEGEEQCTNISYSTYSPKECNNDNLTLETISTYEYNGDVLIELLGPKNNNTNNNPSAAVVITVPHGGNLQPSYIPTRKTSGQFCKPTCITSKDSYTKEIAIRLTQQIMNNFCTIPFIVINHLHRNRLDANRDIVEGAQNNSIAENAWYAFHNFIQDAQSRIESYHGNIANVDDVVGIKGLLLDVHGYAGLDWLSDDGSSGSPFIQWGYRLSKDSLDPYQYCNLDSRSDGTIGTFTHARNMPNQSYECLVRGPNSLGSRLSSMIIEGTSSSCGMGLPSYEHPSPKERSEDESYCNVDDIPCHYYSGGYDVNVHEYLEWEDKGGNVMNAVQMELPRCIRFGDGTEIGRNSTHESFAYNLSIGLCSFMKDLFGDDVA